MWDAAALVADRVAPAGLLMIALYNDQGARSRFWWHVKRGYVTLPRFLQAPYAVLVIAPFELRNLIRSVWNGTFRTYLSTWTDYGQARGMSRWHDLVDWVGGYPFEVARPAEVVEFFARREFDEVRRRLTTTLGCNEFVLRRRAVCG
jgi:2-polyprenyl-6-hydroxyphenyl methylase/3-demethylubiquinone-9 3-methyltransferase